MIELHASNWYEIKGRGWEASFFKSELARVGVFEPCVFINSEVMIDGVVYFCNGVFRWGREGTEKEPYKHDFALMTRHK